MDVLPLQSGSSGNCTLVSAGGTSILIDAGLSGRKCADRLAAAGLGDRRIDGLVISHDHSDHTASMGVLHRRFAAPIHITGPTLSRVTAKRCPGNVEVFHHFVAGSSFDIGELRVETHSTPHDAVDGVCFVIEHRRTSLRFGLLTDLGHVFAGLKDLMPTLDAVLIESNYDFDMLRHSVYPRRLKDRIAGPKGHISNDDAALLLDRHTGSHLQWACLGHLSDENNTPELALATARRRIKDRFKIHVADRYNATEILTVRRARRSRKSRAPRQLELAM